MTSWHDETTSWDDNRASWHDEMTSWRDETTSWSDETTSWHDKMASWHDERTRWKFCPRFDAIVTSSKFFLYIWVGRGIRKHLMTGPEGNNEFYFPSISMFPWNKNHCSPRAVIIRAYYNTLYNMLSLRVNFKGIFIIFVLFLYVWGVSIKVNYSARACRIWANSTIQASWALYHWWSHNQHVRGIIRDFKIQGRGRVTNSHVDSVTPFRGITLSRTRTPHLVIVN